MRVLITGERDEAATRIAAALARGGFTITGADGPFDLVLTLGRAGHLVHAGDLVIDLAGRRVARGGRAVALTRTEFDILAFLARERRSATRDEMLRAVCGYRVDPGTNLVAVHIARLRAKIGHERIRWDKSGYRFVGN